MSLASDEPWLLRLLAVVKTRPGMWVPGPETVKNLETYLIGYRQAREDLGVPEHGRGEENLLTEFASWMVRKTGSSKELNWAGYVAEADSGNKSVYSFFRFFDEFLSEKGMRLPAPEEAAWPANMMSFEEGTKEPG
jgi:hypothetical protein